MKTKNNIFIDKKKKHDINISIDAIKSKRTIGDLFELDKQYKKLKRRK